MKVAIITDTHYNFKKGSKVFHDYFEKFYNEIFFPTLKKYKMGGGYIVERHLSKCEITPSKFVITGVNTGLCVLETFNDLHKAYKKASFEIIKDACNDVLYGKDFYFRIFEEHNRTKVV